MKAYPTMYNGRQYRSRLEARWAAMFDLLGWSFEYEPFDLDGWIPDFVLTGGKWREVLVEVKPVSELWERQKYERAIAKSGREYDYLLVNAIPRVTDEWPEGNPNGNSNILFGEFLDYDLFINNKHSWALDHAWIMFDGTHWGLCHPYMAFQDRITDVNWKKHDQTGTLANRFTRLWNESANRVQWNGTQSILYR